MPYETLYRCTKCGKIIETNAGMDEHDNECAESEKARAEYVEWNARYEANKALWDAWEAHREEMGKPALKAIPSVEHGPDVVAVEGDVVLMARGEDWCEDGRNWYSKPIESPTWGQILVALHKSIKVTKDRHHVFMEGIEATGESRGGFRVFEICTGS